MNGPRDVAAPAATVLAPCSGWRRCPGSGDRRVELTSGRAVEEIRLPAESSCATEGER